VTGKEDPLAGSPNGGIHVGAKDPF
jgi:hypothetical protein